MHGRGGAEPRATICAGSLSVLQYPCLCATASLGVRVKGLRYGQLISGEAIPFGLSVTRSRRAIRTAKAVSSMRLIAYQYA